MDYRKRVFADYQAATGWTAPLPLKLRTYRSQFGAILKTLPPGGRVLDIGCGYGEFLQLCLERGLQPHGVDVNPEFVSDCVARGLPVQRISDLTEYLDQTGNWDAISMIDVLEHLTKEEAFRILGLVLLHLRPGSPLILKVPNMASPFATLNLYHDVTHEAGYTANSMRMMLSTVGFRDLSTREANYPWSGLYAVRRVLRAFLYGAVRLTLLIDQPNRQTVLTPDLIALGYR